MITLIAKRVKVTEGLWKGYNQTEFYLNGKLKAIIPASSKQPSKRTKTTILNCWRYKLIWQ